MNKAFEYLSEHRDELLDIYGQVAASISVSAAINPKLSKDVLLKDCCLDTIIIHRHMDGIVDFPLKTEAVTEFDIAVAMELLAVVMCEAAVQEGHLERDGMRYIPLVPLNDQDIRKYGKSLVLQDALDDNGSFTS
jgi:hypothetical protein